IIDILTILMFQCINYDQDIVFFNSIFGTYSTIRMNTYSHHQWIPCISIFPISHPKEIALSYREYVISTVYINILSFFEGFRCICKEAKKQERSTSYSKKL